MKRFLNAQYRTKIAKRLVDTVEENLKEAEQFLRGHQKDLGSELFAVLNSKGFKTARSFAKFSGMPLWEVQYAINGNQPLHIQQAAIKTILRHL